MENKTNRRTPESSTACAFVGGGAKVTQKARITKIERIRQHLLDGKPITPVGALQMYGSFSLGKVIGVLRRRGMPIRTQIVMHPATGSRFARYSLIQRKDENAETKSTTGMATIS